MPVGSAELRAAAVRITLLFWLLQISIILIGHQIIDLPAPLSAAIICTWTAVGLLIMTAVFLVIERFREKPIAAQVALVLAMGAPAGFLQVAVGRRLVALFTDVPRWDSFFTPVTYFVWFYCGWAAMILAIGYGIRVRSEQRMRAEAQVLAHRAQLQTLRYQLNPHFLFNTLNAIAALVLDRKPTNAERMVRKLSDFLRSGLASDPLADIPLEAELAQQLSYLDIERERFSDRLSVRIDVPPHLEAALVPSFLLQPLVENAVKHGVAPSLDEVSIGIAATEKDGRLQLTVGNGIAQAGDGKKSGMGIGLENVRQRLAMRYGDQFRFSAGRSAPNRFEVFLEIPLRLAGS